MKPVTGQIGSIPERSIMYCLLSLVILIILYFGLVYPNQRFSASIDDKIRQVTDLIKKQRDLRPLYEEMAKHNNHPTEIVLPVPDTKPLPRGAIDLVASLFQKIGAESGVQVVAVRPNLQSIISKSDEIVVALHLKGGFFDFRKFLLGTGALPSLKGVEEIKIREEGVQQAFYLTVRLAVE